MRKKRHLIIALLLTMTISVGAFAYTFTTSGTTTVDVEAAGEIATAEEAASPPEWDSILSYEQHTEILRPAAKGDKTDITTHYPDEAQHWDKVDEVTLDGDGTYVATTSASWKQDLYRIAGAYQDWGIIDYIAVYAQLRATDPPGRDSAEMLIKTGGGVYSGGGQVVTEDWTSYFSTWNINPETNSGWTWEDIGALQIGIGLRRPSSSAQSDTRCSQLWIEVGYRRMAVSGEVPIGEVFDIAVNEAYTGDVAVTLYLLNTGSLVKAYRYLNIMVELEGSVGGVYQLITLENGVANFTLENVAGLTRTLSVTSGSYVLVSGDPSGWSSGWSVIPELYCEITQR